MKILYILLFLLISVAGFSVETVEAGKSQFDSGLSYYTNNKFLLSIGAFKQAIQAGYPDAKVYFYLGNAYINIDNKEKAIEYYDMAYENSTDFELQASALYNKAYVYHLQEDYETAILYYDMAYELNSSLSEVYWLKGMAYYLLRDKDSVISEWETYLTLAPEGEESDDIRAFLELLKGDDFNFDDYLADNSNQDNANDNSNNDTGHVGSLGSTDDLIDISGVLEDVEPSDKGMAEDMEMEDLEM